MQAGPNFRQVTSGNFEQHLEQKPVVYTVVFLASFSLGNQPQFASRRSWKAQQSIESPTKNATLLPNQTEGGISRQIGTARRATAIESKQYDRGRGPECNLPLHLRREGNRECLVRNLEEPAIGAVGEMPLFHHEFLILTM
jgi:hypothetical protein